MNKTLKLSNGLCIPHIGLGTYPMTGNHLATAVAAAYKRGYRLIDTADNYYNEEDLGKSLKSIYKNCGAKREELFLVSKISDELYPPKTVGGGSNKGIYFWRNSPVMQQPNAVRDVVNKKIEDTLRNLQTDYLDLYLMHWPYPDFFTEIWHEMERLYREGKVRAIGVCNCRERHFKKLEKTCDVFPMVNQIETSPLNTKCPVVEYCDAHDIRIMVYSPLMSLRQTGQKAYQDTLAGLAVKYGCEKAQINLRFDMQRGLIPIPKSSNEGRLRKNMSVFDFELTDAEMQRLMAFNIDFQTLPESKSCPGL